MFGGRVKLCEFRRYAFESDYKCNQFLALKGVIAVLRGMSNNVWGLYVCFLKSESNNKQKSASGYLSITAGV